MKLTILACTYMDGDRCCIAGLNEFSKWIRPIKEHPLHLEKGDLFDENSNLIYAPFNVVDVPLLSNVPNSPHSEDWIIDTNKSPTIVKKIDSSDLKKSFLDKHVENKILLGKQQEQLRKILQKLNRSLVLLGPVKIKSISTDKHPKISFEIPGVKYSSLRDIPCTDIKFVDFCNALPISEDRRKYFIEKEVYLCIGLSRLFKGAYWEMIVGVHTIPDYP